VDAALQQAETDSECRRQTGGKALTARHLFVLLQYARESVRQVFRDKAQSIFCSRRAMYTLGEQRCDKARQNVTATAGRELRGGVGIDDRASIRGRDDGVEPFEHDHGAGLFRRAAGPLQLVALEMAA